MNLADLSVPELREASTELENRIRDLRGKRLEIAREIESRFPERDPKDRPAAQTVTPGFIESEAGAFSPNDPEPDVVPAKRKSWRRR